MSNDDGRAGASVWTVDAASKHGAKVAD
ncbi:unnamed protein product [Cuscuta epithymum]|uniref:Uncharacterized protein n=1 Tax=Cuscuta epithymum TaxID=186058 RepID=A0AAV0D207_9ASTE|nr:unnamed protein product [Cuscuta epithymum]